METIWLQRSGPETPWGFRLVGGREFGVPLSVQRVTPGSVAAAGLGSGDVILKVGNVMTSNLDHNDAMELVKQAGNILQLTVKKAENSAPLSPASSYGSQNTPNNYQHYNDNNSHYSTTPRGFGTGISLNSTGGSYQNSPAMNPGNNSANIPSYATTPRKYATQIQIQSVGPSPPQQPQYNSQQQSARPAYHHSNSYNQDGQNSGYSFPDYTIPYKQQEPIHDAPGGPVNLGRSPRQVYQSPQQPQGYNSSRSASTSGVNNSNSYEPHYNTPSARDDATTFSPGNTVTRFNTGMPYQAQSGGHKQATGIESPRSYPDQYSTSYTGSPSQGASTYSTGQFSPASTTYNLVSSNAAPNSTYNYQQPHTPTSTVYSSSHKPYSNDVNNDSFSSGYGGSVNNSSLPNMKPAYNNSSDTSTYHQPINYSPYNSSSNYNSMTSTPSQQPYSPAPQAPKSIAPSSPMSYNARPAPYSSAPSFNTTPKPFQSPMSPTTPPSHPAVARRVSFDQDAVVFPSYSSSPRSFKSPPPTGGAAEFSPPVYGRQVSNTQGPQFGSMSRQNSRPEEDQYSQSPYSSGILSPRSDSAAFIGGRDRYGSSSDGRDRYGSITDGRSRYGSTSDRYDPMSGVSDGLSHLNIGSPRQVHDPPPPPPPPPASVPPPPPPPPPAPPLGNWSSAPYRRANSQRNHNHDDEGHHEKIPDQLLNTMIQSAKGGGPKPFSYGINLSELKKKMGPPTAPKPADRPARAASVPRGYGGYRKPVGQIQSDYYVKRDYDDPTPRRNKPVTPVGLMQSDYYMSRDQGPRAEIDETPISVNMGTNPKKQSKSFKVLQWMTETENDDQEDTREPPEEEQKQIQHKQQRMARRADPERRHNADDDEMKFSGLHAKSDIPSKAFGRLQKMPINNSTPPAQNGQDTAEETNEGVGNYDEASIRYKGNHIPSPSFRVLQTWAEYDPDPTPNGQVLSSKKKDDETDDDLPETLDSEDLVDKRYTGGNIPSKVFKHLQKTVGESTPESGSQPDVNVPSITNAIGQQHGASNNIEDCGDATDF